MFLIIAAIALVMGWKALAIIMVGLALAFANTSFTLGVAGLSYGWIFICHGLGFSLKTAARPALFIALVLGGAFWLAGLPAWGFAFAGTTLLLGLLKLL